MKKILGLDLGTNSIGWALINHNFDSKDGNIIGLGSRIIPMSQDVLGKFDSGQSISQTADRTGYRGTRRLYQRDNLRRERLHRVLNILGFLPQHYAADIDFDKHLGQFKNDKEPKINYSKNETGRFDFLFTDSFLEMANDFKNSGYSDKIPYDWTIYYLRKKALSEKISKEELAWVILNFNQKRGYYQLRGEEEEVDENKSRTFETLIVERVEQTNEAIKTSGDKLYDIYFTNGWKYDRQTTKPGDWLNKTREFIVTTSTTKDGEIKRTYKAVDSEQDWIAIKAKTEQDIEKSSKTVGEFIYESLLQNPKQKIRGKLVRTIERRFYKNELKQILEKQVQFHNELKSTALYLNCINELYPHNEAHAANIKDKGFVYLFMDDIIFYQRPLKSKKSTISECTYETRTYKKVIKVDENGNTITKTIEVTQGINAISKSHPLFQEFRLWQFLSFLRIYKHTLQGELDITSELIETESDWVELFDFLNCRHSVEQKHIFEYFYKKGVIQKSDIESYRWNYVEKPYPCNETRSQFITKLKKVENLIPEVFLTKEIEQHLWHIIYSVKDKNEYEQALKKFAAKYSIDETSFFAAFKNFKPFNNDYGAYSYKALNKLLPLMRIGKYWNEENIGNSTLNRINKILTAEYDEKIANRVREKAINLTDISNFKGLPVWLACYVVYNRHSESGDNTKWNKPSDIDKYLNEFKQHSLRNPIVEQVVTETLRTVRDIWQHYGNSAEKYFNEIHIELGREMKNPADKRKQLSARNIENENTNQRIRELLTELMNDDLTEGDVRPYSPSHQEILKIYEEGVYQNPNADFSKVSNDDIDKIRKNSSPSVNDIKRYKLWLEQGYRSPYTGDMIPLSRLFTSDYQIEHIIPQARYFDDSMSNKIICESEVNQLKSSMTAYEFLKNPPLRSVTLNGGKIVNLLSLQEYETHCNQYFKRNRTKLTKLLSEDIPEGFIERQMNDSRYISKLVKSLLSNIVKEDDEQEATSKNIVPVTGAITSKLKQDWGLNDKWNEIVAPRFMRLNEITSSNNFGYFDKEINAFRCEVPDDLKRNFNKKRIDHRHHALDALVIACTTKDHVNYITSLNTSRTNYGLVSKFRKIEERQIKDKKTGESKLIKVPTHYLLPWISFSTQALTHLQTTVISIKQNTRVINKTNNKTWKWVEKNGHLKKELVKQTKGDNWAIRKPMHKETVSGAVSVRIKKEVSFINGIKDWENLVDKNLKSKIKQLYAAGNNEKAVAKYFKDNPYIIDNKDVKTVEIYTYTQNATAVRTMLTDKLTRKQFDRITDSGIKTILERHLKNYTLENGKEQFELAFNPDGIEELNKNIIALNNGKFHQPIYKVRIYEEGSKFNVGYTGNKHTKYVEAAQGTNLFFAIYWNVEKQKREFETIPLNIVIEHQKQVAALPKSERIPVPVNAEKGKLLFVLSPNDLVYVPTQSELENPTSVDFGNLNKEQVGRIMKVNDFSGVTCYFTPNTLSIAIAPKEIDSSFDNKTAKFENVSIKDVSWKLEVDRLGNITNIIR